MICAIITIYGGFAIKKDGKPGTHYRRRMFPKPTVLENREKQPSPLTGTPTAGKRIALIDEVCAFHTRLVCGGDFREARDVGVGDTYYYITSYFLRNSIASASWEIS